MPDTTFKQLEHDLWVQKAPDYDDNFAVLTRTAIEPMLQPLGDISGLRLLDVACGTGHLAGEAARRGALAEGLDFAETMVEIASRNYPGVPFRVGDAEALPYPDHHFDVVACAFGLLHLPNPETGIAEAYRALRPGGRYVFTVWCSPEQGHEYLDLVMGAIQEHGRLDVDLPPAPPMFRFASEDECRRVLGAAGFADLDISNVTIVWGCSDPQNIIDLAYRCMVRAHLLFDAQTDHDRAAIFQAIRKGAERYRKNGRIEMNFAAKLVVAAKH